MSSPGPRTIPLALALALALACASGCAPDPAAEDAPTIGRQPEVPVVTHPPPPDVDGDGYGSSDAGGDDCDDADPDVHPGAVPRCDARRDDDCDGADDPIDVDDDGDGFTDCDGDCDDAAPAVHPGAPDTCDGGIDDDCDGAADLDDDAYELYSCGWCPTPLDARQLADAAYTELQVDPCALDPEATYHCFGASDDPRFHRVLYRNDIALRDQTLVWFPPGPGIWNDKIRTWAALAGYRVLSLAFWNEGLPADACDQVGGDCWWSVRNEVMYGADTWPQVDIAPADALAVRLQVLLEHLADTDPQGGWDRHLGVADPISGRRPVVWDELVVAGWSEGSGYAAFAAAEHRVRASLLFSGPYDADLSDFAGDGTPYAAPWLLEPGVTPACATWGVVHALERHVFIDLAWQAIGIEGDPVYVEDATPPYGSHWLTTELIDRRRPDCNYHKAIAMDYCMDDDLFTPYTAMLCAAAVGCP